MNTGDAHDGVRRGSCFSFPSCPYPPCLFRLQLFARTLWSTRISPATQVYQPCRLCRARLTCRAERERNAADKFDALVFETSAGGEEVGLRAACVSPKSVADMEMRK